MERIFLSSYLTFAPFWCKREKNRNFVVVVETAANGKHARLCARARVCVKRKAKVEKAMTGIASTFVMSIPPF
jgi:hypothetical protein